MRISVPYDTESSTTESSEDEYLSAIKSFNNTSPHDSAEQLVVRRSTETWSHTNSILEETYLHQKISNYPEMTEPMTLDGLTSSLSSSSSPDTSPAQTISSRVNEALATLPVDVKEYLNQILTDQSTSSGNNSSCTSISDITMPQREMKRDPTFNKWDGKPTSWTPYFHFLKVQCRVYGPSLGSEEALCMKIYSSIPEPQRQRIRGYWIRCGNKEKFNSKEFLMECNKEYFDKIGAQKAKKKLLSMRQGESQIFREFLQEWEMQFEYASGSKWPDSIKINFLQIALSDKIQDKYLVLRLPVNEYRAWVDSVTVTAAIMENSEKFRQCGKATITQYVNCRGLMTSEYMAAATSSNYQASSPPSTTDFEGDISMGGMKLDLNALATLVAKANASSAGKLGKGPKIAAPWRTISEVAELREKKLCLRCKKPGHQSRFCQLYGPPRRPTQVNNLQNAFSAIVDDSASNSGKD